MIPFQITFLDFPESDSVWMAVQNRVDKLEHFFTHIVRCEVVISCPHRHRHADRLYHVQIRLSLPGEDVIISHDPQKDESHRDVYVAIRDAFRAAERKLQGRVQAMRRHIKFQPSNAPEENSEELPEETDNFVFESDSKFQSSLDLEVKNQ